MKKAFDNGARLTAYLMKAYDLKLDDVQQHNYFNGKNCPQTIRESGRWQGFLELAESYLKQKIIKEKTKERFCRKTLILR